MNAAWHTGRLPGCINNRNLTSRVARQPNINWANHKLAEAVVECWMLNTALLFYAIPFSCLHVLSLGSAFYTVDVKIF